VPDPAPRLDPALSVALAPVASEEALALRTAYAAEVSALLHDHFRATRDGDADLAPPDGEFWIARWDRRPVGCVGARSLPGGDVEVKRLYAAPETRGRGVGRALLAAAEAWARARGAGRLVLDTRSELTAACALYRRTGWVEVEAYNAGATPADVWFAKELDGELD
jgi:GNAT superfamily N-acetyltransferase